MVSPTFAEAVSIHANFPGGNVAVLQNEGHSATFAPDLRGDRPWFYWHFEAHADRPKTVEFTVTGEWNGPRLPINGPAYSLDDGQTWAWIGAGNCRFANPPDATVATFSHAFTATNRTVRFAVGIPYVLSNLEKFLEKHETNPHLRRDVLTHTRGGHPVPLLRIGQPAPERKAMLLAARSHACEAMASYVLEGFLDAALSDTFFGRTFRERHVLYVVPLLDFDGVQAGDQGKNRRPHDHNRDYGKENLYPETAALQALAKKKEVVLAVDFHCPLLRGDIHETFYWAGLNVPHVRRNLDTLTHWMEEELPPSTQVPRSFGLRPPPNSPIEENLPFSNYFAQRPDCMLGVTLEVPYTQRGNRLNADLARAYGAGMLRAWVRTAFLAQGEIPDERHQRHPSFTRMRDEFRRLYMGNPEAAQALVAAYLDTPSAPPLYRNESHVLMGRMRLRQRRFDEAIEHLQHAIESPEVTTRQHADALAMQLAAHSLMPAPLPETVQQALRAFEAFPHLDAARRYEAYEAVSRYYELQEDLVHALHAARQQLPHALDHQTGVTMHRIARMLDRLGRPEEAGETREEGIRFLEDKLHPIKTQGGIFYGIMAGAYFELLRDHPKATEAQRLEAVRIVSNYSTVPVHYRQSVREWMEDATRGNQTNP